MPLPPAPAKRAALLAPDAYTLKGTEETLDLLPAPEVTARTSPTAPPAASSSLKAPGNRSRKKPAAAPSEPAAAPARAPEPAHQVQDIKGETTVPSAPVSAPSVRPAPQRKARPNHGPTRLFVLDTNVLLHDPMSPVSYTHLTLPTSDLV